MRRKSRRSRQDDRLDVWIAVIDHDELAILDRDERFSLVVKRDVHLVGRLGSLQIVGHCRRKRRSDVETLITHRASGKSRDKRGAEFIAIVLVLIGRSRVQAAGTGRLWHTVGCDREVFDVERSVRLEADHVTLVAEVKLRAASGADGATGQAIFVEVNRTKVFAVTAVLPSNLNGMFTLTFEIKFAEEVASIFTLDWALARGEETSLVLRTKYSHFRSSL